MVHIFLVFQNCAASCKNCQDWIGNLSRVSLCSSICINILHINITMMSNGAWIHIGPDILNVYCHSIVIYINLLLPEPFWISPRGKHMPLCWSLNDMCVYSKLFYTHACTHSSQMLKNVLLFQFMQPVNMFVVLFVVLVFLKVSNRITSVWWHIFTHSSGVGEHALNILKLIVWRGMKRGVSWWHLAFPSYKNMTLALAVWK